VVAVVCALALPGTALGGGFVGTGFVAALVDSDLYEFVVGVR
jgi:hypothetical protein